MIILFWIILSFAVGAAGSTRKIGFFWAFLGSLLLSPLVGIIFVAFDKKKDEIKPIRNVSDELQKLFELKNAGALSENEYEKQKQSLLEGERKNK